MNPERWQRVEQLYHTALARDADGRASFLAEACAGDEALRREVESLLAHRSRPRGFSRHPRWRSRLNGVGAPDTRC